MTFKIYDSFGDCVAEVKDGEKLSYLLDFDENVLLFSGQGILATYDSEERAAEIFDEMINAFNRGKESYKLPVI